MSLIYFLQNLKPKIAIEIGTHLGGSLQVLSHFSSKVYSLDIDPKVPQQLAGKYSNVEYLIGDSSKTLPILLEKLQKENAEVSFILIDGDHETEAVKKDIEAILQFKPIVPLYILMHDSFLPSCRVGIMSANWNSCPYVHVLELDYVPGRLVSHMILITGMAIAISLPYPRQHSLQMTASAHSMFCTLVKNMLSKANSIKAEEV